MIKTLNGLGLLKGGEFTIKTIVSRELYKETGNTMRKADIRAMQRSKRGKEALVTMKKRERNNVTFKKDHRRIGL
jgi:hypothetical protein